jgi:hypothetical protein
MINAFVLPIFQSRQIIYQISNYSNHSLIKIIFPVSAPYDWCAVKPIRPKTKYLIQPTLDLNIVLQKGIRILKCPTLSTLRSLSYFEHH